MRNECGGGGGSGPNATVLVLQAAEMESGLLAFEDGPAHPVTNHMPTCISHLSDALFFFFFFFLPEVCYLL